MIHLITLDDVLHLIPMGLNHLHIYSVNNPHTYKVLICILPATVETVRSTNLAAILVTNWNKAWKRRAIGDGPSFKTSVVASNIRAVQSFPGTPA